MHIALLSPELEKYAVELEADLAAMARIEGDLLPKACACYDAWKQGDIQALDRGLPYYYNKPNLERLLKERMTKADHECLGRMERVLNKAYKRL